LGRKDAMICRGPYPDVEIPEVPLTGFVLSRAAALGEKPAVLDGSSGRVLTYGGLAGAVRRVAAGLAGRGFGKGDVFAVHGTREESSRAN
jgi:non-ribosomal peptide synthetase component E (peptide arylation enzyme)